MHNTSLRIAAKKSNSKINIISEINNKHRIIKQNNIKIVYNIIEKQIITIIDSIKNNINIASRSSSTKTEEYNFSEKYIN